jgi:hypothetical protein
MRTYIVIPEGTPIVEVEASTPAHASSKARRGKGTFVSADAMVLPASRTQAAIQGPAEPIPGQLALEAHA